MKKIFKKSLVLLYVALFLLVTVPLTISANNTYVATVTVNDVAELKTKVENAIEDTDVSLSDTFDLSTLFGVAIAKSNTFNVTVDGNGSVVSLSSNKTIFSVTSNAGGDLTFTNFVLDGQNTSSVAFQVNGNLTLSIKDSIIKNFRSTAVTVGGGGGLYVENTLFQDNMRGNGGAIGIHNSSVERSVKIVNSSFIGNKSIDNGYDGGAISVRNTAVNLIVENSYFEGNQTDHSSGSNGGRGGAIAVMNTANSVDAVYNVSITNSYFKENIATQKANTATFDGGAIAIFNLNKVSTFFVDGCTFDSNSAGDDGGAILLQTYGTIPDFNKIKITNSTFYNNSAHGKSGNTSQTFSVSGGAIQIFANRQSFAMTARAVFEGNTFYGNFSKTTVEGYEQRGGAIASSGGTVRTQMINNVFVDNKVFSLVDGVDVELTDSLFKNLSLPSASVSLDTGNLGIAFPPDLTLVGSDIYGQYPIALSENSTAYSAGSSLSPLGAVKIPTLLIAPGHAATGVGVVGSLLTDQRGFARRDDSGATEIAYIKYDANGGNFTLTELTEYVGTEYYEGKDPVTYYGVTNEGGSQTVKDSIGATKDGYLFVGWSTDANALVADPEFATGIVLSPDTDVVLYAVWNEPTTTTEATTTTTEATTTTTEATTTTTTEATTTTTEATTTTTEATTTTTEATTTTTEATTTTTEATTTTTEATTTTTESTVPSSTEATTTTEATEPTVTTAPTGTSSGTSKTDETVSTKTTADGNGGAPSTGERTQPLILIFFAMVISCVFAVKFAYKKKHSKN